MPSEFLRHSYSPSSVIMSPLIYGLFENLKDKATVLAGWTSQGPGSVRERTISHPSDLIPTQPGHAERHPSGDQPLPLRPVWPLQPPTNIFCVYVYMYIPPSLFLSSAFLPYPSSTPEVSLVSDLHSKRTLLTYLPTTGYAFMVLNLSVNAFYCRTS